MTPLQLHLHIRPVLLLDLRGFGAGRRSTPLDVVWSKTIVSAPTWDEKEKNRPANLEHKSLNTLWYRSSVFFGETIQEYRHYHYHFFQSLSCVTLPNHKTLC